MNKGDEMTHEELKDARSKGYPVVHCPLGTSKPITYTRVSAIIYRKLDNGTDIVQAEVVDKSNHSASIANPKYLQKAVMTE